MSDACESFAREGSGVDAQLLHSTLETKTQLEGADGVGEHYCELLSQYKCLVTVALVVTTSVLKEEGSCDCDPAAAYMRETYLRLQDKCRRLHYQRLKRPLCW